MVVAARDGKDELALEQTQVLFVDARTIAYDEGTTAGVDSFEARVPFNTVRSGAFRSYRLENADINRVGYQPTGQFPDQSNHFSTSNTSAYFTPIRWPAFSASFAKKPSHLRPVRSSSEMCASIARRFASQVSVMST